MLFTAARISKFASHTTSMTLTVAMYDRPGADELMLNLNIGEAACITQLLQRTKPLDAVLTRLQKKVGKHAVGRVALLDASGAEIARATPCGDACFVTGNILHRLDECGGAVRKRRHRGAARRGAHAC